MVGGRLLSGEFKELCGTLRHGMKENWRGITHDGEDEEEGRLRWIAEEAESSDILTRT